MGRAYQIRCISRNDVEETTPELPRRSITLDKRSGVPLYVQLAERIRWLVREGRLRSGDPMPTVRTMAIELGINANTVARVYRDLRFDGVLRMERGLRATVAEAGAPPIPKAALGIIDERALELIRLARQFGFRAAELAQLIETRWREEETQRTRRWLT